LASSTTISAEEPAGAELAQGVGDALGDGLGAALGDGLGDGLGLAALEVEPQAKVAITTTMPSAPRHGIRPW
jgi:hypothetical protein